MSLSTRSQFFYGFTITSANNALDFSEGGPELQATLNIGDYSLEEILVEIKRAMEAAGALTYTVSVVRSTRVITISAGSTFQLLAATGTRVGTGVWSLIGFSAIDRTGASTYASQNAAGSVFRPQAIVDEHIAAESWKGKSQATVAESADGTVQVATFGDVAYVQMNIWLQTNNVSPSTQPEIEQDLSGVANLRTFMDYAVTKAKMEFMPDRNSPNTFNKVILDKTPASRDGIEYRLEEMRGCPGYFSTGKLVFRVVP